MMMRLLLLSTAALCFTSSIAADSGASLANILNGAYPNSFDFPSFENGRAHRELDASQLVAQRRLQQIPVSTTRTCGQDLGITPKETISQLINALVPAEFGNVTLDQTVNYDVQALVVCGSCQSVASEDLFADVDAAGFGYYCAEGAYGYNVTQSGVLFLPIDPDTGEIIANKKLKASVFAHSLTTDTSLAPSEIVPENLTAFIESSPSPTFAFGSLYNVIGGILSASAGVISVAPDYVGFGQNQVMTKNMGAKLYRQATIPLWLTAKDIVSNTTLGCTEVDNVATVGGCKFFYSS